MIIWSGAGILVFGAIIGGYFSAAGISELLKNSISEGPLILIASTIAAVLNFGLFKIIERYSDRPSNHSFFFIPVKYWTFLLVVLGGISGIYFTVSPV